MREAYAITGYVPNEVAKHLKAKTAGKIDVAEERGATDLFAQVDGADVIEVRTGAESGGHTLVQLILREQAPVHTVLKSTASAKGLESFHDPALGLLKRPGTVRVILV